MQTWFSIKSDATSGRRHVDGKRTVKTYASVAAVGWTAVLLVSLAWQISSEYWLIEEVARHRAIANFEGDMAYRHWAAGHGGVYAPVTERTPPNPHLEHLPERDITTPSGRELTLVNPAYMTRQAHEIGREHYRRQAHITSLDPIRAENAPDAWEARALALLKDGGKQDYSEIVPFEGEPHLRYMRPLMVDASCMSCHAEHGYQPGDQRGGISVSIPMAPYWALGREHNWQAAAGHGVMWLAGLAGIFIAASHAQELMRAQRKAERNVRNQLVFMHSLLSALPCPVFYKDAQGRYLGCNPALVRFTGIRPEALIGKTAAEIWPERLAEEYENQDRALLSDGSMDDAGGHQWDGSAINAKGETRDVVFSKAVFKDVDGRHGGIVGAFTDVTDALRASRDLAAQLSFLDTMMSALPSPVFFKDTNSIYLGCNDAFAQLTGRPRDAVVGRHVTEVWPGDLGALHLEKDREAMARGIQIQYERAHAMAEGYEASLVYRKAPYYDGSGMIAGVVGVIEDVTHIRNREQERLLWERRIQQAQKLESLGIMAGGVAHDFNNILMIISGHAELARREAGTESALEKDLEQIQAAASKAGDLARQMLAYSGKGNFELAPNQLNDIVLDMKDLLLASLPKVAEAAFGLAPDLPAISCDPVQIRQVLSNLVTNAGESLEDEPGRVSIATGLCELPAARASAGPESLPPGRYVYLEVSDTGKGMDEPTAARMFDPFFSTKFAGRGLGMSVVQGIVKGHGGGLDITSRPGSGTCVRILFPTAATLAPPSKCIDAPPKSLERAAERMRVLLADDEPSLRKVGSRMLKSLGFKPVLAADGHEVMAQLEHHGGAIACVLLDLTMPRLDGRETLRMLRDRYPALPVVLCSGFREDAASQDDSLPPYTAFLHKPYDLRQLRDTLTLVFEGLRCA